MIGSAVPVKRDIGMNYKMMKAIESNFPSLPPGRESCLCARHLRECPVQSHEWQPARQHVHTWPSTYVGPRASQVQSRLWDPAVLEQCSAAIAT